jgi:hypothetical protein
MEFTANKRKAGTRTVLSAESERGRGGGGVIPPEIVVSARHPTFF